jgi:hypothetical protein
MFVTAITFGGVAFSVNQLVSRQHSRQKVMELIGIPLSICRNVFLRHQV